MPKSKIETCEINLAKVNGNISKFIQEHNIDEIKTNRNIINYYNRLKESEKESYLLSKNVTLDTCRSADKLYVKFNRLKKKKEKLEQEIRNLTSESNISPTSVSTNFFSTNISSLQQNVATKNCYPTKEHDQPHLNNIRKTLFQNIDTPVKKPTQNLNQNKRKYKRKFLLPNTIVNNYNENDISNNPTIFLCRECSCNDVQESSSSTLNDNNEATNETLIQEISTDVEVKSNNDQSNNDESICEYQFEVYFCHNCNRDNQIEDLPLFEIELSSLNRRRKFRFLSKKERNNQNDYIHLCKECLNHFSEKTTRSTKLRYDYLWPSFIWSLLTNTKIQSIYGTKIWQFLCPKMRRWWLHSVSESIPFFEENRVTLEEPRPIFSDNTENRNTFMKKIKSDKLGDITDALNEYLLPNILCPWGCSEYIHECTHLPFDLMCQRYLNKVNFETINQKDLLTKFYSTRDDYIRFNVNDYDCWIFNPDWNVVPNITFLDNEQGPHICTCRNHRNGSKKFYIHPPRLPHHLPSYESDQLSHAVIRPRTIKNFKSSSYSNSYQMHEQKGSFQGIDTCDICNYGDFTFLSKLLNESESRSISNRADINDLLDKFEKNGFIAKRIIDDMREMASKKEYSYDFLKRYMIGATYLPLQDCLKLQGNLNDTNLIQITREDGDVITIKKIGFLIYITSKNMNQKVLEHNSTW